jgi:hypothetical protein
MAGINENYFTFEVHVVVRFWQAEGVLIDSSQVGGCLQAECFQLKGN